METHTGKVQHVAHVLAVLFWIRMRVGTGQVWVEFQDKLADLGSLIDGRNVALERAVCVHLSENVIATLTEGRDSLCMRAHCSIRFLPKIVASSSNASVSSFELKIGKRFVRKATKMIPADQMSRAGEKGIVRQDSVYRSSVAIQSHLQVV